MSTRFSITTQLPSLPISFPDRILTSRLILRPVVESDLQALYSLASQPDVAQWSSMGVIPTIEMIQTRLLRDLANHEIVKIAICLKDNGKLIGTGGVYSMNGILGWPVVNYSFIVEEWGKGFGSEFLTAFIDAWWTLPRIETQLKVDPVTVFGPELIKHECITSFTTEQNIGSLRVMEKSGMKLVKIWNEKDLARPADDETLVTLIAYASSRSC